MRTKAKIQQATNITIILIFSIAASMVFDFSNSPISRRFQSKDQGKTAHTKRETKKKSQNC